MGKRQAWFPRIFLKKDKIKLYVPNGKSVGESSLFHKEAQQKAERVALNRFAHSTVYLLDGTM